MSGLGGAHGKISVVGCVSSPEVPVPWLDLGCCTRCVDQASLPSINAMSSDGFAGLLLADYICGSIVRVIEFTRWGVQCRCLLDSSR